MSDDPVSHALPSVLDMRAAAPLRDALLALRGSPLDLDASGVANLGGLCLQVILSAAKTWDADGCQMRIVDPSEPFQQAIQLLGQNGPGPFAQPELSA